MIRGIKITTEEYNTLKKVLFEETDKCRKDPEYAKRLLAESGIYNEDGSLNSRYKNSEEVK